MLCGCPTGSLRGGGKSNMRGSVGTAWSARVKRGRAGCPALPRHPGHPRGHPESGPLVTPLNRSPAPFLHLNHLGAHTASVKDILLPPSHLHHPNLLKQRDRDPCCWPRCSAPLPHSCPRSSHVPPGGLCPGAARGEQPAKVLSGWSGLTAQLRPSSCPGTPGHFNQPTCSRSGMGAG